MKIRTEIDNSLKEIELILRSPTDNEEVQYYLRTLNKALSPTQDMSRKQLVAQKGSEFVVLELKTISRFFALDKKCYASSKGIHYQIKHPLYELEALLPKEDFFRISNSEIINLNTIKKIEVLYNASLRIVTKEDEYAYVSRSNIKEFKKRLGF